MLKVALFAAGDLSYFEDDFDYFVGLDRACLFLLEQGLPLDLAVGDFDSVSQEEFQQIEAAASRMLAVAAEKDDTDSELALKTIFKRFDQVQVTIFGAFGGRLDHTLSNIFLPSDPELAPRMTAISLRDSHNLISYLPAGQHQIQQATDMTYVSFMTDQDQDLRIEGAKYDLTDSHFFKKKIYSSNEFINQPIQLTVDSGYILVIQTRDRTPHD